MSAGRLVLENQNGEVVRTFGLDSNTFSVVYRHDVRRIEVLTNTRELDEQKISYDILKTTTADSIAKRAVSFENGGKLRWVKEITKVAPSLNVADDSEEQEKAIYKYTAATQVGTLLLIFIIGLLIEPLFMKKQDEPVVIVPQEFIQKKEQITVKAAEHKIDPVKKVAKHKVVSKVKEVPKTLTAKVRAVRHENAPLRTKVTVEKSGVLGVLGGMKTGSKHSAGFNMNAANDSRGTSWNGAGAGGVGGMERAIPGKGLVGATMGQGAKIEGGGGYGTRGKAGGGRPGYGTMNLGGTGAAYFQPAEEEALVEGGLDKDQIAAVINRHIGEVIYCYEKGLQVKSGLSGRVSINWVINAGGIVNAARVENSSLKSAQVEACIVSHLRGWQFPHPVGGVNVKVSYPFVLKRVNHG
jgi:outer membrane biosynthesis protein TonB